jgi:hypothetical protein
MSEPTDEQTELAGKLVDLINTAWSLRARVADVRNLRMGFVLGEQAHEMLTEHGQLDAGFGPAITYTPGNPGTALFCGVEFRGDPAIDEWGVALVLAPGDSE